MSMTSPTTYSQEDLDLINSEIPNFDHSAPTTSTEDQAQKTTENLLFDNVEEFPNTLNPLTIDELQTTCNIELISNDISGKSEFLENETIPIPVSNSTENVQPLMTIENVTANLHQEDGKIGLESERKDEKADQVKSKPVNCNGLNFFPGDKLEAKDFNEKWYSAKVVETDWVEREVLIHFDKWSSRFDEWIPMDSPRLRMLQTQTRETKLKDFVAGERILATWADGRKYPAKVNAVLGNDRYDVLFDDGYAKIVRSSKMSKLGGPLDDQNDSEDFVGSKEKRKDRNRKYQVMDLFQRKPKKHIREKYARRGRPSKEDILLNRERALMDSGSFSGSHDDSSTEVLHGFENPIAKVKTYLKKDKKDRGESTVDPQYQPEWIDGEPQGVEAFIEGPRRSIIIADKRLPPGWVKYFIQRKAGSSAGKWDVLFVHEGSEKKFRTRSDIKAYMASQGVVDFNPELFDFCIHRKKRGRGEKAASDTPPVKRSKSYARVRQPVGLENASPLLAGSSVQIAVPSTAEGSAVFVGGMRVEVEDKSYKCPKESCQKNFRRENLLQMHIKHYHPEYSKFLGSTPNVADLAYARTIGESIDDIIPKQTHNFLEKINKFEKRKGLHDKSQLPVLQSALSPSQAVTSVPSPTPPVLELEVSRAEESRDTRDEKIELGSPIRPSSETLRKESDCAMSPGSLFDLKIREEKTTGIKTLLPVRPPSSAIAATDSRDRSKSLDEATPKERGKSVRKRNMSEYHHDSAPRAKKRQSIQHDPPVHFEDLDDSTMDTEGPATPTYRFSRRKSDAKNDESNDSKNEGMILINGELVKVEQLRKEEIINCTCKFMEEDGLMIQCDLCLCWQHGHCNAIEKEKDVPDKYVCFICRHPYRQRPSMKYALDQEWIKEGKLPSLKERTKNDLTINQRTAMLKRSYDLIGSLFQIQGVLHSLRVKINVAQKKDHPKLYLWAKNWEKLLIPKPDVTPVPVFEIIEKSKTIDDETKIEVEIKTEEIENLEPKLEEDNSIATDSDLVKILEDGSNQDEARKADKAGNGVENFLFSTLAKTDNLNDLKTEMSDDVKGNFNTDLKSPGVADNCILTQEFPMKRHVNIPLQPFIPEPEAPIDLAECRMRLLEHIDHFQNYIASKLTSIEAQVQVLEEMDPDTIPEMEVQPRTKQTVQMLLRDLGTIRKLASLC